MTTIQKQPKNKESKAPLKSIPEFIQETPHTEKPSQPFMSASLYAGPLPPSSEFKSYENTLPGAADRILKLAESEALHRRHLEEKEAENRRISERKVINHNIWIAHLGQIFAFTLGLIGLIGAMYCASIGQQWAASIIATGGLATLIAPFLKDWKSEKN